MLAIRRGTTLAAWLAALMLAAGPCILSPCYCADAVVNGMPHHATAKSPCCGQQARSCCSQQRSRSGRCPCCTSSAASTSGEPCAGGCHCAHRHPQPASAPAHGSSAGNPSLQKIQVSTAVPAPATAVHLVGMAHSTFLAPVPISATEYCAILCRLLI